MDGAQGDRSDLVRQLLWLLMGATLVIGILLMLVRGQLSSDPAVQDTILQFGSGLASFGFTTLLVTVFATKVLETQLVGRVGDEIRKHVDEVGASLRDTTKVFEKSIGDFNPLVGNSARLGLVNVYLTRTDALADFAEHIDEELSEALSTPADPTGASPKARLWIVASSMKGIREIAVGAFHGEGQLKSAGSLATSNQLDVRILMTHPRYANLRASQEQRQDGAIPEEINETLYFLRSCDVPVEAVRLVSAMPTVFAIATRREMLLNPYPYSAEGLRSFALRVRKVHALPNNPPGKLRDIFEQYERRHFEVPWSQGMSLSPDYRVPNTPDPHFPSR